MKKETVNGLLKSIALLLECVDPAGTVTPDEEEKRRAFAETALQTAVEESADPEEEGNFKFDGTPGAYEFDDMKGKVEVYDPNVHVFLCDNCDGSGKDPNMQDCWWCGSTEIKFMFIAKTDKTHYPYCGKCNPNEKSIGVINVE